MLKRLLADLREGTLQNKNQSLLMSVGSFVFLCFVIDGVIVLSASLDSKRPSISTGNGWLLVILGIAALILGILSLHGLNSLDPAEMPTEERRRKASDALYSRYLVGLGFFLFVDAMINMVAFAGFAASGKLNEIFPLGDGALDSKAIPEEGVLHWIATYLKTLFSGGQDRIVLTAILSLSLGMALLGALLFFAKSLWDKYEARQEIFDSNIFWAGLWFRLAEAITFTVAMFLFFRFNGYKTAITCLPMIALFLGLTVKSSENLIFGLAERLLASVTSLVQPGAAARPSTPATSPPAPPSPSGTLADFDGVVKALSGTAVRSEPRKEKFKVAFASLLTGTNFETEYATYFKDAAEAQIKERLDTRWRLKIKTIKANLGL